jgi:predicted phage-related endonuclease
MEALAMTITYHHEVIQGSEEWTEQRLGLLTASEMKLIITPGLKAASNDKERSHLFELMAQRITKYVEPHYVSDDMLRGHEDEIDARIVYGRDIAPVTECGFVTNDEWGFKIGYSPDALVGDDGAIECKSRRQKYQAQTIIEGAMPDDYLIQVQTGLLVTRRKWIDFISYCGGMPMVVIRVFPDPRVQNAIIEAASAFEERLRARMIEYPAQVVRLKGIQTERRVEVEMHL